jgi:hypothetical protein
VKRNPHAVQLHWRLPCVPSRAEAGALLREWIRTGRTPRGVTVRPIYWGPGRFASVAALRAWLRSEGLRDGGPGVVETYAAPGLVMCDYDGGFCPDLGPIWHLSRLIGVPVRWVRIDRTRRGWHVFSQWARRFTDAETVALQAILGSDPKRESYNLMRVLGRKSRRNNHWNLMFRKKCE